MDNKDDGGTATGGAPVDAVVTLAEHQGWNKKK
jgi:hypothetical protein